MAPVEITPHVTHQLGVPEGVSLLDTDVPWPRSVAEFARERARLAARLARMTAGPKRAAADLSGRERYVLGVRAGARWTAGETAKAPIARADAPVTGAQIRAELAAAELVMQARGAGWEFATGTLHWLLWATGADDEILYPEV